MPRKHLSHPNMAAGRTSRYQRPENDYGSATMPMTVPTSTDDGGRAYPGGIPRQGHGSPAEPATAKGDHSSKSQSRGRPTPSAGDALPMNGGTSSRVPQQDSRRSGNR